MTNPFSSYHFINVTNIIKNNIRLTHFKQNITDLFNALIPLTYLFDLSEESSLNNLVVAQLRTKPGVLDVLIYFGFERNNADEYIYRSPRNDQERKDRENGTNEFHRFFAYLQTAQRGNFEDLLEFFRYSNSNVANQSDTNSLPYQSTLDSGNTKTMEIIDSLKELPPEQTASKETTKTSIDNLKEPLKKQYHLINQPDNKNKLNQQFSRSHNNWEPVKHIVPAIQQIRRTNNTNPDETFSKIFRLLNTELSHIIGPQIDIKIEILSSILCEISMVNIEYLDIFTIKVILFSNNGPRNHDDFRAYALKCLSVECPICLETFPRSRMEAMFLCTHMCCSGCAKEYYRNNIDQIDIQSINVLTCFMERHEIPSDQPYIFFGLLSDKLNQWFHDEKDLMKRYHDKIFHATRGKQIKECANPRCISSYFVDNDDEITSVRCPHCEFRQCGRCSQNWYPEHKSMNCQDYINWLFDNDIDDPDVQVMMFLSKNGIICPNKDCQEIYERHAGGDEHFTCPTCKTDFCRMCSSFYYFAKKDPKCPIANCVLKSTMHTHCAPNCFREIRIGRIDVILKLLKDHGIDVNKELEQKSVSRDARCTAEDCGKAVSIISGNRFCETCFQQFLWLFIWNRQLEPWEIYEDNNIERMLRKASVSIPANVTRQKLVELCQQHLNPLLGKPTKIPTRRF